MPTPCSLPQDAKGPITVISGKKRRVTFFECPTDLNAMVDVAKVADLVIALAFFSMSVLARANSGTHT